MQDFDAFWNYADPNTTEIKFREVLNSADTKDELYIAELKTQIARTLGLQRKFEDGHSILNEIDNVLIDENAQLATRYFLEKGRLHNSNNEKELAYEEFMKASECARLNQFGFYQVDALHMLGIVAKAEDSLSWNEKAITAAETATEARAKNWLGSLYNNTGWTYFDMKQYDKAIDLFQKCLFWNIDKNRMEAARIAKYSIAKSYRMQGKHNEALFILDEIAAGEPDGYIHEELAENYLATNDLQQAKENFQLTYDLLSEDIWLKANEQERIARWESFIK